jgi:large subunit ribosomal protein L25
MKTIEIKATARKNLGKKQSKALRKENHVPCVLYGGKENIHFSAHENTFKDIIYTHYVYLITLNIDGNTYPAILKEMQFHPVTDKIQHIDFIEVSEDKPVFVSIPVDIVGSSIGVKEGGKMRQRKRYLRVKGLSSKLPDAIELDITELSIGQSILAGDLSYNNFEILEGKRAAVVSVISSRAASKSMGEEPVVAVAAPAEATEEAPAPATIPEPPKK